MAEETDQDEQEWGTVGAWPASTPLVRDASEEVMLLWGLQQPTMHRPHKFVQQTSSHLHIDACGQQLSIAQAPSSLSQVGVTGGVMWDSGVVLAKFLEHAVDCNRLDFKGRNVVELGAGCGLVGCVAGLLGAKVVLTDLPDRLKLLQKNVRENALGNGAKEAAPKVMELVWGDEPDPSLVNPLPDFIVASDVVYNEDVVPELLDSLRSLCDAGGETTVFLSGELRNDAVLECFLEAALGDFVVGNVPSSEWHPDFRSSRVALFVLCRK